MAARIIPFQTTPEQNDTEIERLMRKWLAEISSDTNLIDCVSTRMMVFIKNYASQSFEPTFNLAAPRNITGEEAKALLRSIETGVDQAAGQVQEMINKIIVERFLLEVEIYESRYTDKITPPCHSCPNKEGVALSVYVRGTISAGLMLPQDDQTQTGLQ